MPGAIQDAKMPQFITELE